MFHVRRKKIAVFISATKVSLMKTELVTTLKRQATRIIADLRTEKAPVMITEHGKPAATTSLQTVLFVGRPPDPVMLCMLLVVSGGDRF